ncbi:MAG TPA: cobaltochelatase subunit CobN [Syntrophobacter fumaroxidans]|nr:cobaltochelatase subunit CobN [Syntrophobacter fumaroxidans]
MKLLSIMWSNYVPLLKQAAAATGTFDLKAYSNKQLNLDPLKLRECRKEIKSADLILFYRTTESFWDELEDELKDCRGRIPVVTVGPDIGSWKLSNVNPEIVANVYRYLLFNGGDNFREMLKYLAAAVFSIEISYAPPKETAWEGIFHPQWGGPFDTTREYLEIYPHKDRPLVGVLFSRSNWVSGNLEVESRTIAAIEEQGLGVLPVFFYSIKDANLGNLGGEDVVRGFFLAEDGSPLVDAVVKLTVFFLGQKKGNSSESQAESGVGLLKALNVPLVNPVISYYKDRAQWLDDPAGLGQQVAWSIALPEFEGVVEPLVVGASKGVSNPEEEMYEAIPDRIDRLARRISRWVRLRRTPNRLKKIAFMLHNNPCASVEATVGGGAHLDTLESVARVLHRMKDEGYAVTPPENGKALIDEILDRKAISEFRWTTTGEIAARGGCLAQLDVAGYSRWFDELPEATRNRTIEAWGRPPGEEKDGVPAAMVYEGKILVTGVRYGNAVVCVQPKRGCAGARCDGQVCRILHDPNVPPPHQYVATYKWLSRDFGADAIVHVGTHGNLEFLPGKGTGLSSGCFPDIGIDEMPNLYIYNADNPPEGTTAKRRSCAVLVDHMQAVMIRGELYGDLDELERLMSEYDKIKLVEPGKAHTLRHMIEARLEAGNLLQGMKTGHDAPFDEVLKAAHEALSLLRNTYIPKGMHVFGSIPEGERLSEFIYAVVRYENTPESLRGVVKSLMERDEGFRSLDETAGKDLVDEKARAICAAYLEGEAPLARLMQLHFDDAFRFESVIACVQEKIDDVQRRVALTDEMSALLNGAAGGYVPPGPSGIVTRGRPDILPTGRNFYSLDPHKVPSRAGWEVGVQLAGLTIEKFLNEEGKYPENIAFYWQCTDIMWSDGEGMAQMMYLLGVRPVWQANGRVSGFEIIPLEELGRPRIDITVRVSGITRDNFASVIELIDEAVQAVAALDEPPDRNFVRGHLLAHMEESGAAEDEAEAFRKGTFRLFSSMPGVYQAGTQLAVYASAWKDEKDLCDVFLYWNGYAYGKGVFGEPAHRHLSRSLETVELTFAKTVTDEYDLLGCCCHFGTHGGLINAAKVVSGRDIKTYYGDTREMGEVRVRDLADEIRRIVRTKLLNPKWIEGMKEHGYKGAGEISKRVGRVYGWEATSREVDDWIFDDIARTFLMDEGNRKFFEENNPYALEETARRLIEAAERGLWAPSADVRDALKEIYVEIEGWIEEKAGEMEGDFQGGSIDIITSREVESWKGKMDETLGRKG